MWSTQVSCTTYLNPIVHGHIARVEQRIVLVDGVDHPLHVRNMRQNEREKNLASLVALPLIEVLNHLEVPEPNFGVYLY